MSEEGFDDRRGLEIKVTEMRAAYTEATGKPCEYFYCPILLRDEKTELCKAHIVNRAFPGSSRKWTVQRKDVDNFYGTTFEGDFTDIREVEGGDFPLTPFIADSSLAKRFNAKILIDDEPVSHLYSKTGIPEKFTQVQLEGFDMPVAFGLKMHINEVLSKKTSIWEVEIFRDLQLPVQVSVIKAAHLTLFDMLGYKYALNSAGTFVGNQILGVFFERWRNQKDKSVLLDAASSFFREHRNMTRQVSFNSSSEGTSEDRNVLACIGSSGRVWAMIVFVKTSTIVHGAMIPVFDEPESVATYLGFMQSSNSKIHVSICHFEGTKGEMDKDVKQIHWPKI